MATATLDTSVLGRSAAKISLTTETLVTLSVVPKSGTHHNHRVTIEHSPDGGITWIPESESINGTANSITFQVVATDVRACVCEAEGAASEVTVHLLAR
jgi:photosystem II stability/assembly factor-like uncharacterized protein